MFTCPVCGYDKMLDPPEDFNICPCCGFEFENDDFEMTHDELRERWIMNGMPWFSSYTSPPDNWDKYRQLSNVCEFGLRYTKP